MKKISNIIYRLEKKYIPNIQRYTMYKATKVFLSLVILGIPYILYKLFKKLNYFITYRKTNSSKVKLQNIINGWYNLVLKNNVVEHVAMERAKICAKCPFAEMSNGVYNIIVDNKTTQVRGLVCKKCGCPLSAKIRSSQDSCPLNKW